MHLHSLLKSALLLLSGTALFAAPVITLNTTIPSQQTQIPHSICANSKGGYLVCGTAIDSNGHKNGFLLRTNRDGVQNGRVTISSTGQEIEMLSTCQTFDGGYVVSGFVNPGYYGNEDWGIIKYDSLGKRLWTRQFGYSGNDRPLSMIQTADSGFLMAGYTVGSSLDTTVAIKKLDKNGLPQWDVLRRTTWSIFTSAKQTRDKGYILTGGVRSAVNGKEALLFKVDSLGNVQWYKPYGGKKDEIGYSVDTTSDGGYIVAGSTTSYGKGKEDALVFKVDSMGNLQWFKTFGGVESDEACGIVQTMKDYYFVGNMRSFSADSVAMVYQLTCNGDSVWSVGIKGFISNVGKSLQKTAHNLLSLCCLHIEDGDTLIEIAALEGGIAKFAAGGEHSLILTTDGILWACGSNSYGQHGDGTSTAHSSPVKVISNVQSMAAGYHHSLILKTDGTLWSCGLNSNGQLGDGTFGKRSTPVQIMANVNSIAAGSYHSLILKSNGTLWACGSNYYGECGDGSRTTRSTPIQIMSNVQSIAAGGGHSLILKTDGTLWACGNNEYGQLGNGTTADFDIPIKVMTEVQSMAAGSSHSLILKSNGTLWACGSNNYGECGDGSRTTRSTPIQIMSNVQSIAAGGNHSLILKTDGTLWACGNNEYGQLGNGTTTSRSTPIQVMSNVYSMTTGAYNSFILKTDGTLWAFGLNRNGQLGDGTITEYRTSVQIITTDVQSMAMGGHHSMFLKADGTLWACGLNSYGQLGDGTITDRSTPIQVMTEVQSMAAGGYHSLILKTDGSLWACGFNNYGQLGDGTTITRSIPVQIMAGVQSLAAGEYHNLILKADGTLWVCGLNYDGQLGDGTRTGTKPNPIPFQVMSNVQSIAAGGGHSMILKTDGTLWACGGNESGQLGDGTTTDRSTPVQVMTNVQSIAAGDAHSLILKTDETLYGCGLNIGGRLGTVGVWSGPGDDALPPIKPTPIFIMENVQSMAAGVYYSLIQKNNGTLWTCGKNYFDKRDASKSPVQVMTSVQSIATGKSYHSLILKTDGTLWACGLNSFGQLGDGHSQNNSNPIQISLP